jgi:hypothetical protein
MACRSGGGALLRPASGADAAVERVRREICASRPRGGASLGIDGAFRSRIPPLFGRGPALIVDVEHTRRILCDLGDRVYVEFMRSFTRSASCTGSGRIETPSPHRRPGCFAACHRDKRQT